MDLTAKTTLKHFMISLAGSNMDDMSDSWEIRYSSFVGELILFDPSIYGRNRSSLQREDVSTDMYIVRGRFDKKIMMVQISHANMKIPNIDKMTKSSIIEAVKEKFNGYKKNRERIAA